MKRLPYRLPEFAPRISWVSARAREVWAVRLSRISNAYLQTERNLVAAGARPSALQHVSPEQLPVLLAAEAKRGNLVLPLAQVAKATSYQSAPVPLQSGAPFDYRCAITRPENAERWATAWNAGDNDAIGGLLGYPACCREFFKRYWVTERWMDTTWPMALLSSPHPDDSRSALASEGHTALASPRAEAAQRLSRIEREGARAGADINMLWRWFGVRSVSHLPCSFGCAQSSTQGAASIRQMAATHPDEARWLEDVLSWPVRWTSLRGIAEITTPIFRAAVPSDAVAEMLEVRYEGVGYPVEGARGDGFPFRSTPTPAPTIQIARPAARNPAVNGFFNIAAQSTAHSKLLAAIDPGTTFDCVVDLGCGDGELLLKVPARRRVGVETHSVSAFMAEMRLDKVIVGDCTSPEVLQQVFAEKPDLIIAQRNRNPVESLPGYLVLSYSYDADAAPPQLVRSDYGLLRRRPERSLRGR